jgi:hypothetical protein
VFYLFLNNNKKPYSKLIIFHCFNVWLIYNYFNFIGDFNGLNKCTSIINLFAIQPKSIQEGLLCVSSPDMSILEQLIERRLIEPINNLYPKPLTVDVLMGSLDIPQNDPNGNYNKIDIDPFKKSSI